MTYDPHDPFVSHLFNAGRAERSGGAALARTLTAVATGAAVGTMAASSSGGVGAKIAASLVVIGKTKLVVIGAVSVVVAGIAAFGMVGRVQNFVAVSSRGAPVRMETAFRKSVPEVASLRTASELAPSPSGEQSDVAISREAPSRAPVPAKEAVSDRVAAPSTDARALLLEVKWLEAARSALAAGDGAGAFTALDRYVAEVSVPRRLEPEARYLRIEATCKQGLRDSCRALAQRFLAQYGASAQRARVEALLSGTSDDPVNARVLESRDGSL